MNFLEFIGLHPILTVILALITSCFIIELVRAIRRKR